MSIIRSVLSVILLVTIASAEPLLKNVDVPDYSELILANPKPDYRLPDTVIPTYYFITLTPNIVPNAFTFKGESLIHITVKKAITTIILHAKDLVFDELKTTLVNEANHTLIFKPTDLQIDPVTDFLTLNFAETISNGSYILSLTYSGILHDDLQGFYRSSYKNERGEEVWLATTQFEPTYARRAFPCFDEPALKAIFQISINHYDNYTVRSNTKMSWADEDPKNPAKTLTIFKFTPLMSTYLIGFVISDFKSLTSDDGKFRVWSKSSAVHTGKFAHEIGRRELELLETYTGIPETMDKMDNFAIPQFRAGAMENWGIVTYRESALLFDENVTTTNAKQSIATVISHEFAHQWFGNLVSPLWWTYAWLNEGFANYFQYYITDKAEPTWRLMEQFVIKNLQETAFVADVKEDQHAMNVKVDSPQEISSIFDSISYSKAGCVIRMFSHALTEDVFQKGLIAYLKKMQFKAARSDDLFDELVVAATEVQKKIPLKEALNSWATQPGYPVLMVTVDAKQGTALVTQKRFLSKNATTAHTEKWWIPINYVTQEGLRFNETQPTEWLKNEENSTITVTGLKDKQWIIFNKRQTGYYRVNYDKNNWALIAAYLNTKNYIKIDVLNRAQILDDSFNLAHAGVNPDYNIFLSISRYLQQEVDYVPWHAAFRAFNVFQRALANTPTYGLFKLYMLRLTANLEKSVGYTEPKEQDDHVTKFNRINAVEWACHMGSAACRTAAHKNLVDHITGAKKISPDLRSVILCAGLRTANSSIWEKTFKIYETSKNEAERTVILNALGCASDEKILESYLAKTIQPNSIVPVKSALMAVRAGSAIGIHVALDFVIDNYKAIYSIDNKTETIVACMNEIASSLTTQAQVDKLDKFITANKDVADALKAKGLVNAKSNIAWVKRFDQHIGTFMDAQGLVVKPVKPGVNNSSPRISFPPLSFTIFLVLAARFASFVR